MMRSLYQNAREGRQTVTRAEDVYSLTPAGYAALSRSCVRRLLRGDAESADFPGGRVVMRSEIEMIAGRMRPRMRRVFALCVAGRTSRTDAAKTLGCGPATVGRELAVIYAILLEEVLG